MFWALQLEIARLSDEIKTNKPKTAKVGAISKAQNLKEGPFGLCETPAGCKKFLKNEGGPFGDLKKFPEKNFSLRFLNSVTVPKNVKGRPLTSIVLQNIETNEGGPSGAIQKLQKKSHSAEKKWG